MGGRQEAVVKIACIQMQPVVGEKQRNLQTSLAMIEEAASQGARLIVLPELCNSGYLFASREEAFELAEPVPPMFMPRCWARMRGQAGTEAAGPGA
jgi:N-carbamoylputrescine amidase